MKYMDFLTELREANDDRQTKWPADFEIDGIYKSNELANEVGELAGAVKKLYRHDNSIAGNTSKSREDLFMNLEEEIGDAMICLDLLASYYGVDIEKATRNKFNRTSNKVGIDSFL